MLKRGQLTDRAQRLRKNMTPQERHLWYDFLKNRPERFRRQKVMGAFIVDFCCPSRKLVIELDGGQHYEDAEEARDRSRAHWLEKQGYTVLRYTNTEVDHNFFAVCEDILKCLPPEGEGGTA